MPVHREKETKRAPRRETSTSSRTGERPIITQINPRKVSKSEGLKRRELTYSKDEVKKTTEKQARKTVTQRDRTRTRTLSPTEVKQLHKIKPEEPKPVEREPEPEPEPDYEDDFEEYESDFEDESKEEEQEEPEVKAVTPEPVLKVNQREIDEIKMAMKIENEMSKSRKSTPDASSEVGEESHMLDFSKKTKEREKTRRRGRDLLSMITLDAISYSFLDMPSIPYETYMKMFGRRDMKQVHIQTNEDDLNEETQTDVIEVANKWIQNPPEVGGTNKYRLTREEKLGVGGDFPPEQVPALTAVDTTRLNDFLLRSSEILLPVLESKTGNNLRLDRLTNKCEEMYFSDGFLTLNVEDLPFLNNKSVTSFFCSKNKINPIFSVHGSYSFGESIICMWNVNDLSRPMKVLRAMNGVTSLCSDLQGLVFAGLVDGTVCLWDLKESSFLHQTASLSGWVLRSPTYSTAQLANGHLSRIVSIQVLMDSNENHSDFAPVQVCTLEEKGTIIIWSVVQGRNLDSADDLGLAHWGNVKLVKTSTFTCLGKEMPCYVTCNDLALDQTRDVELYVANSLGSVIHMSKYGTYMKPKLYRTSDHGGATCLEICPFDSNYFLAGCKDGSIRLCSRDQELPLISLNGTVAEEGPQAEIVSLCWLLVRPFIFFALDSLCRIHIWDLGLSDMYPEVTLTLTNKKITCVKLIQSQNIKERPYFMLGTKEGKIEIHRLKEDYSTRPPGDVQKDMKKFLKYVSILVDLDEVLVLESKVVSAMARLQKSSFNGPESDGIDHTEIVDFLSENDALDGDLESQVITALQSGIRKGFICGLRNGNYSLVGPGAYKMIARCYNTVSHGPKCTCSLINVGRRHCCSFRLGPQCDFVKKDAKNIGKRKSLRGQKMNPRKPKRRLTNDEMRDALHLSPATSTGSNTCENCGKIRVLECVGSSTDLTSPESGCISI